VLSSELIAESGSLRARIEVTYALEPTMELFVPREMREKYSLSDGSTIEGKATYARFRRYQVTVTESVK
jgi:cell wall assembly regulator SMI1